VIIYCCFCFVFLQKFEARQQKHLRKKLQQTQTKIIIQLRHTSTRPQRVTLTTYYCIFVIILLLFIGIVDATPKPRMDEEFTLPPVPDFAQGKFITQFEIDSDDALYEFQVREVNSIIRTAIAKVVQLCY